MNFHNMTQKNLFESYIAPSPMISRCYSSKANGFSNLPGNSLYLGNMRHLSKKNTFGPGHLKMPPLEHRSEFCDPLVKIVGGFVGSKSQAGTTSHRGREFSLWDVIVDKIIETMENPEPRQQTSRKSADTNGKKNGKIHKIESFTMIEVGQYGTTCTTGSNFVDKIIETIGNPEPRQHRPPRKPGDTRGKKHGKIHKIESYTMIELGQYSPERATVSDFDSLSNEWCQPSKPEFVGSVHLQSGFPGMGIFRTSDFSPRDSETAPLSKNSEPTEEFIYETEIATFCKGLDPSVFKDEPACKDFQHNSPNSKQTTSRILAHCSPLNLAEENEEFSLPASFESLSESSDKIFQVSRQNCLQPHTKLSNPSPLLDCAGGAPKHILRPEAAEFTPRISGQTRPSLESESDESIPVDVLSSSADLLSSSCESQTPSDTFLRPKLHRTLSECSVDSDDSFIVFESAEDDLVILSEDSADEDSCSDEDLDEIDNPILIPHNLGFSQPPPVLSRLEEANKKWAENYSDVNLEASASATKKVSFAEGSNLVTVKHLIAWEFAHRAARIGPWEMYHRDSERFKSRITALSAILSPVLAQRHREKIYAERFQGTGSHNT